MKPARPAGGVAAPALTALWCRGGHTRRAGFSRPGPRRCAAGMP